MLLGLDQSLVHTGWALYDPETQTIWSGEHRTFTKDDIWQRLASLEALLEAFKLSGTRTVVIEDVFGRSVPLWRVQTAIRLACLRLGLPCESISADQTKKGSWRYHVGLKRSDKGDVIKWAHGLWGAEVNSHQADALGILCGWLAQYNPALNPYEAELINVGYRLEWSRFYSKVNAKNELHPLRDLREVPV